MTENNNNYTASPQMCITRKYDEISLLPKLFCLFYIHKCTQKYQKKIQKYFHSWNHLSFTVTYTNISSLFFLSFKT